MDDERYFLLPNGYLVSVNFKPNGIKIVQIETISRPFIVYTYSKMITVPFMDENRVIYDITFRADCKDLEEFII